MATQEDAAARGFRRLSSLFLPAKSASSQCHRCRNPVYHQERMGPVHDVVFHKACFKCVVCGHGLSLKNYWSNQVSGDDPEIYCPAHVPRIGGSGMGADALGIRRAIAAQRAVSSVARSKLRQIRQPGAVPKVDGKALEIRSAVSAQREWEYSGAPLPHTSGVDGGALHIKGAVEAQLLQRRNQMKLDKHHFPPHLAKKREELFVAQKKLEERLREEEDELFKTFHRERQVAKSAISQEIEQEWENRLRQLTDKYEQDDKRKSKKGKGQDEKVMTIQFEKEKQELEQTMTVKRKKITQTATLRLREKEQRATSDMVKKQSMEMLTLLAAKQEEVKEELKKTLEQAGPPPEPTKQNGVSHASPTPDVTTEEEIPPPSEEEILQEALEDVLQMPAVGRPASPRPPVLRKKDLFPDESIFAGIDEQVIKVAEGEQPTYTDLVRQLTEDLVTDLEKVRAIYRWITVKDLNVMEFADDIDVESPMGLLRGIKFGTETYHVLFMRLCSYAGLHCVEVKGHSKSVGYEPGMKITTDTFLNTWNSVLIAGDWRLVQCNWGARHLVLSKDREERAKGQDKIRYQYDEHYFLTDPDEFIQEFWPLETQWQLLESPITLEEFESLPFVRSIFFHYGMHFDGHRLAVLDADDKGGCKISIRIPEEYENDLVFYYQLRFADRDRLKDLTYKGVSLERFVFQTMVENTVTFSVHVPTPSEYFLEIFANKIDETSRIEDKNTNVAPFKLKCACKFKVVANTLSGKMHPLPDCAPGEWGPKKAMRHFGIIPVLSAGPVGDGEKVGIIMSEDKFSLRLRMPRPLQFMAKLRMNQVEEKTLDPFVQLEEAQNVVTISVMLPQQGQYGLDIYARPKSAPGNSSLSHASKYLVNCSSVSSPVEIPRVVEQSKRNKWGPTPAFDAFALELLSHKEPKLRLGGGATSCTVEVHVPDGIVLSYQFLRQPDEDNRENVVASRDLTVPQTARYQVTMPQSGNYMLCLYARREDSEDRSLVNVYNYLLVNKSEADVEDPSPPSSNRKSSSIFKKGFFSSKKDKPAKEKPKSKDRSTDRSSDKSSDKSV